MAINMVLDQLTDNIQDQPRLLIADDDYESAKALQMYLERQGYEVRCTTTGTQTLDTIAAFNPHLLIIDLFLPDISGLDITIKVRGNHDYAYLPVIMITGQDEERKRLQSMVSGADDYLAKPVVELELLVRVQALLRTKMHIDRLWAEKRHLLEDLKRRNAELETALQAAEDADILKRNILQSVSHEMGTPMLQIKSAVHLLVEDIRVTDPDSTTALLATKSVQRLEGIIHNVRDLAQSENLKNEPFVLIDSLNYALRVLARVDDSVLDRVQLNIPNSLPPLYADKRGVGRVLTIFLENAVKFDPTGKPVVVEAVVVDTEVKITVRDQGIGISPEFHSRIFQEFYQVDSSTTRRFGGSGVGLALAKLLCDQMKTQITVESTLDEGSAFSFMLPIAEL